MDHVTPPVDSPRTKNPQQQPVFVISCQPLTQTVTFSQNNISTTSQANAFPSANITHIIQSLSGCVECGQLQRQDSMLGGMQIFPFRQINQTVPKSERGGHSIQLGGLETLALQPFQVWTNSKKTEVSAGRRCPKPLTIKVGLIFLLQWSISLISQVPRIGSPTSLSCIIDRSIDGQRERFFITCLINGKRTLNHPVMRCCFDIRLTSDWWVFQLQCQKVLQHCFSIFCSRWSDPFTEKEREALCHFW